MPYVEVEDGVVYMTGATYARYLAGGDGASPFTPLVNVFDDDDGWPDRPTATIVFWIGGDASEDDPSADMQVGDVWYPASE